MSDFLAMGGYAAFVWPTWAVSALAIGGLVIHAMLERKAAQDALQRIEEDEA